MSINQARWSDREKDERLNRQFRAMTRDEPVVRKTISVPVSVIERVENLQRQHMETYSMGLSFSSALASLVLNAPLFRIVPK